MSGVRTSNAPVLPPHLDRGVQLSSTRLRLSLFTYGRGLAARVECGGESGSEGNGWDEGGSRSVRRASGGRAAADRLAGRAIGKAGSSRADNVGVCGGGSLSSWKKEKGGIGLLLGSLCKVDSMADGLQEMADMRQEAGLIVVIGVREEHE